MMDTAFNDNNSTYSYGGQSRGNLTSLSSRGGSGVSVGQSAPSGEDILQRHTDQTLNRVETQGSLAVQRLQGRYGPEALQLRRDRAVQNAERGVQGENALQDSAQEQYGVELTEAQQKARQRMRGIRFASAKAAAANNEADVMFEERLAAISDAANIGTGLQNTALNSIAQAENVSLSIDQQNQQLRDQHRSGIGGLIGAGIGAAVAGPGGALAASQAGSAIF